MSRFLLRSFVMTTVLATFMTFTAKAQYSPTYYLPLKAVEKYGAAQTNFPALFIINTQAIVSQGYMNSAGDDIRFSLDCPDAFLNHWVESGMNTDSTRIWVRIPSMQANDSVSVVMYFGDTSVSSTSSFTAVFPNALTTTSNMTLSGTQNVGWLKVNSGHTITIVAGQTLTINAEYAEINGVINGKGKGYMAPSTNSIGLGPGGGGTSTNSGSGGGGYGGTGGMGGYDSGDTPGAGGVTYGTATGSDIQMGSSGGSAPSYLGGAGGGCFVLNSSSATITGAIIMDADSGQAPGSGQCGGGGAGGGIKITSDQLTITGNLSAKGGDGSTGTSTANDSGGGGGGGRIKLFHGSSYSNTATTNVAGGIGGPYGTFAPGQNGQAGTVNAISTTFKQNVVGTYMPYINSSANSLTICQGDSILLAGQYQMSSGVYYDTLQNIVGCDSIVETTLTVTPVDTTVTVLGFTLTAQATGATLYQWYNCSTQMNVPGATSASFVPSVTGDYACKVTQAGCTDMSSCYTITINPGFDQHLSEYIHIFPNPAENVLFVDGFKSDRQYSLEILDILGRTQTKLITSNDGMMSLDLSDMSPAIYLVRVSDLSNSTSYLTRIVKQ